MTVALAEPIAADVAAGGAAEGGAARGIGGKTRTTKYAKTTPVKSESKTTETVKTESKSPAKSKSKPSGKKGSYFSGRDFAPGSSSRYTVAKYRQLLAAELIAGSIVILLQPTDLQNPALNDTFTESIEQLIAYLVVFAILSLLTTAGIGAAKAGAAFGGLILLVILMRPQNATIFSKLVPVGFRKPSASSTVPPDVASGIPSNANTGGILSA